ncbi:unnamed protein product [Hermetia illucens]|uniref:Uncharacterized protein n=1 Tax=Hermetia illucens TaxID=343691 RepID=A0A7R8UIK8_HERIL|nr:unnamed protein product [Hermetia illucens]
MLRTLVSSSGFDYCAFFCWCLRKRVEGVWNNIIIHPLFGDIVISKGASSRYSYCMFTIYYLKVCISQNSGYHSRMAGLKSHSLKYTYPLILCQLDIEDRHNDHPVSLVLTMRAGLSQIRTNREKLLMEWKMKIKCWKSRPVFCD